MRNRYSQSGVCYGKSSLDKESPLRIPLEDIFKATNNFAEEQLLKRGGTADSYKGMLLRSSLPINVVIWRFSRSKRYKVHYFEDEISILSRMKHRNIASFIGFCDEEDERMIVMEHVANGSLEKLLNDPTTLTWSQRLNICYGAALAVRYIQNDIKGVSIDRHHFIKSSKILLDRELDTKMLCIGIWSHDDPSSWYDPKNTDVHSLGVILLEVLCWRKLTAGDVDRHLAQMQKKQYHEQLNDLIDPTQMHSQSLIIFSETIGKCFKCEKRSDICQIVESLKEALEIQWKHENPLRIEAFAYLKIPLNDIKLATNDFSNTYRIKSDRDDMVMNKTILNHFTRVSVSPTEGDNNDKVATVKSDRDLDMVYKAQLGHFGMENVMKVEGENKGEPPKRMVIIKRIINQKYGTITKTSKEFFAEINMLTSCKHPNLVSLLGICDEDSEMILVFECTFKQSLDNYLGSMSKTTNLTWEQRIRVCLDIAYGLKYLHNMNEKSSMIHQGILSANVILDDNWTAKIANFRISDFNSYPASLRQSGVENFRTWLWDAMDAPWIPSSQRLVVDDIYCLGVILFEILTGRLAYDPIYMVEDVNGLASMARRHYDEGKLKDIADPRIVEEAQKFSYTLKIGPDQDSFYTFSKIAYQCLVETPNERPNLEVVIKSLEKALYFPLHNLEHLKISLEDIKSATKNFDQKYLLGSGGYGEVYKAELSHVNIKCFMATKMQNKIELPKVHNIVAIKRIFNRKDGEAGFLAEVDALSKCEHPNIVSLLGFCVEDNEMLLVYEHMFHGSLDIYLENNKINLTWKQRLKMCIDIAQGLSYLHKNTKDKRRIIHRDIKSANILLGKNWEAKIADFGLSKLHMVNNQASTINTEHIAGTSVYLDPEYAKTGKLKKASDVYSFGVVLFEIFSGTLAYDLNYMNQNVRGLAPIAQRHFENGTLSEILDPKIMEEAHDLGFTGKVWPDQDSLDTFSRTAYQCLDKNQSRRPTIEEVLKELEKSLSYQENRKTTLKFSLEHIKLGTRNFNDDKCISRGGYGNLYKGKVQYENGPKKVTVKRFSPNKYLKDMMFSSEQGFLKEFEFLFKKKQNNIIGLVGYYKEMEEKIIVYEHASKGTLNQYLKDTSLSWTNRLKICIDIASGLKFLHGGELGQDVVVHRDIKSSNILLNKDRKPKICGFEHSIIYPNNIKIEYVIDDFIGSPGYCDPLSSETNIFTKESDIYSFGVILFEILCGRLACPDDFRDRGQFLDVLVKRHFEVARLEDIVFEDIKEQIAPKSFATFRRIAFQCLQEERKERPTAGDVLVELQKALEFQEANEEQEAEMYRNYNEILKFSKSPKSYSKMAKTFIIDILSKGILLEADKQEIMQNIQGTSRGLEESLQPIPEEEDDHLE